MNTFEVQINDVNLGATTMSVFLTEATYIQLIAHYL
jgi:hypothetical protein